MRRNGQSALVAILVITFCSSFNCLAKKTLPTMTGERGSERRLPQDTSVSALPELRLLAAMRPLRGFQSKR